MSSANSLFSHDFGELALRNTMHKEDIFYKFTEITTRQERGAYWLSLLQRWINWEKILTVSAAVKIMFPIIPTVVLLIIMGIAMLLIEFVKIFIGKLDEKKGVWKLQNAYNQKKEHLAPFNNELRDTLKEICKKLEIKDKFNGI